VRSVEFSRSSSFTRRAASFILRTFLLRAEFIGWVVSYAMIVLPISSLAVNAAVKLSPVSRISGSALLGRAVHPGNVDLQPLTAGDDLSAQ